MFNACVYFVITLKGVLRKNEQFVLYTETQHTDVRMLILIIDNSPLDLRLLSENSNRSLFFYAMINEQCL